MIPVEACGTLDLLEGLLQLAWHQGQGEVSWDTLCAACEDTIVAAGLGGWDTHPLDAHTVVADLGRRLAAHVVERHVQRTHAEGRAGDQRAHLLTVSDLLQTLAVMRTDPTDVWAAVAVA